jgi:hypothetical protein
MLTGVYHLLPSISCTLPSHISPIPPRHRLCPSKNATILLKLYDVCDPDARGQWLDVLIAMVEYLRSGESKVGYLNNSVEKNMLDKDNEVQFENSVPRDQGSG